MFKIKMSKKKKAFFSLSFFLLFAFLICNVLQKTKAQKNSVRWHHAWKGDILHIYFPYVFKNIHEMEGFFA